MLNEEQLPYLAQLVTDTVTDLVNIKLEGNILQDAVLHS